MSVLRITRGLPASGKTTIALAWVNEDIDSRVRVNRDEVRNTLYGQYVPPRHLEDTVTVAQHATVRALLAAGKSVVVDDTNLRRAHAMAWVRMAAEHGAAFEVVDVTHVGVEECVARDARRAAGGGRHVGEDVIRGMHSRYLAKGPLEPLSAPETHAAYVPDETLPEAWVFDVDGTLALMNGRGPFEWHRVGDDMPNVPVVALAKSVARHHRLVIMSGRDGICRDQTVAWLETHGLDFDMLVMRAEGDSRKDAIVKRELFFERVAPLYHVVGVVDDRRQVVDMWRSLGIVCAQVAPGDF